MHGKGDRRHRQPSYVPYAAWRPGRQRWQTAACPSVRGQPVVAAETHGLVFQRSGREPPQVLQRAGKGDAWQIIRLGEHGPRLCAHQYEARLMASLDYEDNDVRLAGLWRASGVALVRLPGR